MSITKLNIGGAANDGNGQDLRSGGQVINDNFAELDQRTATAQAKADAAVPSSQKGVASGVATLGADGKIPVGQLPPLAVNEVFTVATQAAILALTAERGDMAIRTDQGGQAYVLAADAPTVLANWIQIKQNLAAALIAIGAVAPAVDTFPYFNGTTTAASAALTAKARLLLARPTDIGMRAELGLGTAAVLTATTSTSDATVGSVLRVGDHGLGSTVSPFIADMNAPVGGGYSWVTSGTANPITGWASGSQVLTFAASAAEIAQMYFSRTVPVRVGTRRMTAGAWQAHNEILTLASAVLDPALSTGGVINTTTVSGFTFTKFLGGLLMISGTGPVSASLPANTATRVDVTIPAGMIATSSAQCFVVAVQQTTADHYGVIGTVMTTTTNMQYIVRTGVTAQTFLPRIMIFARWQ